MSLLTDGTNYYLQPNGGPAVELSYGGSPVTVGEFAQYGAWTPIAAAQTASGYEVAWSIPGADQYQIWLTDSSGNELSIPFVGSGAQVEFYEASFNYDLNGDGTIGPTVIESSGTMSLLTDGTNYYLQPNGGPAVELSYGGSPVTVGEFASYGAWTPIAAAQTASGYEVAWAIPGADQYQIWLTDSSGNELSIPFVGSGAQVASYEVSFNHDLNGDGILTDGTNYYLQPNGRPAVELSFDGAPVTVGEFAQYGAWTPIAAAQTASGYEVAWSIPGADQYQIWLTDSSGNEVSIPFQGSGAQVEFYEASFNYDLNGDGTIGPTVIESSGTMSLLTDGTNYYLQPNGGPAVELSYGGSPVTVGEFASYGAWTPIAAAQTASGYEVAWAIPGADQYQIWLTDSSGNELSIPFVGSGAQVASYEVSFNHDLNGDGILTDGTNYYLQPNGRPAVELSFDGAPVTVGEFAQYGAWTPIAAAQTASGYEVAWSIPGADQYQIWLTDSSGNEVSIPFQGSGAQVEFYEASFNYDLNGDGTIGPTVIESSGTMSLLTDGTNYYLQPNGGPAVELSYGGSPVTVGEFASYGAWTPIAAAQTASGYEVAWAIPGADQYQIWLTDSSGNELSIPFVGSGAQVASYEVSFNHDLNGDGTIGIPTSDATVIVSDTMSLLTDGTNYYLQPNGGPAVELSYGGSPVTVGEFAQYGAWTPIAAAQTASGYEVAWSIPGADQYQIWLTDSSGNELSIPFQGSGAQVASYEASFNDDLNGDGTIGVPPPSPPQFVYEGTDANGAQVYDITNAVGSEPIAVRVLTPQDPSTDYPHSFLYALPVEGGLAQSTYGSGLDELANLDVEDQYNATIIEPIFPMDSWYADNPNDPTIDYETFVADILPQWVDSNFSTTGTEQNLLVGFSKSGYGALDLELKHPSVFSAVAAFDFPGDMTSYDDYGSSSADDYGTQANFQDNYEMNASFIDAHDASFTAQDRILISEGPAFTTQVTDFGNLLTSEGVMYTSLNQTNDAHNWSGGWLSGAIAGLYGLEQNLNSGARA